MFSLAPVKHAGQAAGYFAQDNYFTLDEGLAKSEWFGQSASALGLKGEVDKDAFFALLEGQIQGQQVGRNPSDANPGERAHRAGTDLTFSAPKSVSVLAEVHGLKDVRQAHEKAAKAALSYVESHLVNTRVTKDGETIKAPVEGSIFAMFRHNTSRNLDPQTHTHAILLNLGKTPDDEKWRSIVNDEIYKERKLIGAIYNNELARELNALGYDLTEPDRFGNFEVNGVSKEAIEAFSTRREQVKQWLDSKGIDPEQASFKELETAALSTRPTKKTVDHGNLVVAWKERAVELGEVAPPARTGEHKGKEIDPKAALGFALSHLYNREMVVTKESLLKTAMRHAQGRASALAIVSAFDKAVQSGDLLKTGQDKRGNDEYAIKKSLASERWTLASVRTGKDALHPVMSVEQVAARLEAQAKQSGMILTQGQREAVSLALSTTDRFVAIQGLAGTGKTTMLRELNALAVDQGLTVRAMAPTGAAAKTMGKETGIASETVAMFQIKERALATRIKEAQQYAEFQRKPELWVVDESSFLSQRQFAQLNKLAEGAGARVVYLGDTAQLQGVEAGKPFEMAQKDGASTALMGQIARQKTDEAKTFVNIITQDLVSPSQGTAPSNVLRHNARAFDYLDSRGRVHEQERANLIVALVDKVQEVKQTNNGVAPLVITPFNRDRQAINEAVRARLQTTNELGRDVGNYQALEAKGWTPAQTKAAQYYKANDVVRFNRAYKAMPIEKGGYANVQSVNQRDGILTMRKDDGTLFFWQPARHNQVEVYDAVSRPIAIGEQLRITRNGQELKNGETVTITGINEQGLASAKTRTGDAIAMNLNEDRHFDYAYASTVHASQGATAHTTLLLLNTEKGIEGETGAGTAGPLSQAELVQIAQIVGSRSYYVAGTRASHTFEMFVTNKADARELVGMEQSKSSAIEKLGELSKPTLQKTDEVAF